MHRNKYINMLITVGTLSFILSGCNTSTTISDTGASNDIAVSIAEETKEDGEITTDVSEISTQVSTEEASSQNEEADLTDTQRNSMNMLNHITVLTQEINSSKNSKLYLEQAYSSIENNYNPNAIDERTLGELEALLDTLDNYRMIAEKRDRLEYIYEQNQAQALRDAVPNPLALIGAVQSFSLAKIVASVSYMAIDSLTNYQSSSAQADLQYLQDGWALDDEEAETLHEQRKGTFSYMVKTVNENKLPGKLSLTNETVDTFVEWKNNQNVVARIRFLESNKDTYSAFGGYWLTLADSYYENGNYKECLDAMQAYENLKICIFRFDYDYAEKLPIAIAAAGEVLTGDDYITTAEHYVKELMENTRDDNWALRYFAAQTYIDLYAKTNNEKYLKKAYDITLDNANSLVAKQHSMNNTYLEDIVKTETPKGATSQEKDDIKEYNKMLTEKRKTELAPVNEPLMLNCDLLFSLAEKMNISSDDQDTIEQILHENGNPLFLTEEIDNLYRFAPDAINESDIEVSFDGDELIVPVKYVSENAKITVTVNSKDAEEVIDDWKIDKVKRNKENEFDKFQAVYTSETAKNYKYTNDMNISIEIDVKPDSDAQKLNFKFTTAEEERFWIVPDKLTYTRLEG